MSPLALSKTPSVRRLQRPPAISFGRDSSRNPCQMLHSVVSSPSKRCSGMLRVGFVTLVLYSYDLIVRHSTLRLPPALAAGLMPPVEFCVKCCLTRFNAAGPGSLLPRTVPCSSLPLPTRTIPQCRLVAFSRQLFVKENHFTVSHTTIQGPR
jgi:hypothetical protein